MSIERIKNRFSENKKLDADDIQELFEKVEELENDVDYWQNEFNDMEEIKDDLECKLDDLESYEGIKDLEEFKWQLKLDNLWDRKLEDFLDHYLKYHNA